MDMNKLKGNLIGFLKCFFVDNPIQIRNILIKENLPNNILYKLSMIVLYIRGKMMLRKQDKDFMEFIILVTARCVENGIDVRKLQVNDGFLKSCYYNGLNTNQVIELIKS